MTAAADSEEPRTQRSRTCKGITHADEPRAEESRHPVESPK
jgi:hypothetical protein